MEVINIMTKNYLMVILAVVVIGFVAGGLILYKNKTIIPPSSTTELNIQISGTQNQTSAPKTAGSNADVTQAQKQTNVSDINSGLSLTVSQPADKSSVTSSTVAVSGKTQPKADVSVNDTDLKADIQGNFSTRITLDEGENTIVIVATDENGNYAEKEITVTYQTPE